ncbi:DUF397 domain-containing protein [Actinokineospora spheciospongiae]|uniref:DUF397 domain-containing protein n=1 Tax=Actinokineospora spheciospongiae TaxID=909613 RepID=UPI0009FD8C94|nr:DUF397 domain-containing protein [Actinokineospora spheciospongiae]
MASRWRRSSFSGDSGNCAEVVHGPRVGVRDSKSRGAELWFPGGAWVALRALLLEEPAREQRR